MVISYYLLTVCLVSILFHKSDYFLVQESQEGKELIIKGINVPSGREQYLLRNPSTSACPVCASGLDIKHTDVLILSQFVRSDGCMLPRRITGLCTKQQKRMSSLVTMAQKAGNTI